MKWSEIFKKLGINMDDEVDETSTETSKLNNEENKKEIADKNKKDDIKNISNDKKVEINDDKEGETKMAFKAPKVDKNGLYDLTDIEDADMKAFFKTRNDERKAELAARKAEDDKRVVNDAISKYASKIKFADGWGLEDALKLGDFSKVANDENIDKEIENAFTNLKTAKAGMFVADKQNTSSNPMLEGFNPQNTQQSGTVPNSFVDAFGMME